MPSAISFGNRLLDALSPTELERLTPHLEPVALLRSQSLAKPGEPIEHVYFVREGVVSLVQPLDDGAIIEVGMIGNEGCVGLPALLGATSSPLEAMVQIPGSALRMPAETLREAAGRSTALMSLLLRYAQALHVQVCVSAACNGRHTLAERLAHWLLAARDRSTGDRLPVSHELLSMMLGVRRAGVTVALGGLRSAGLVANTHGQVTVIDRVGLEKAACECYRTVRDEHARLLHSEARGAAGAAPTTPGWPVIDARRGDSAKRMRSIPSPM